MCKTDQYEFHQSSCDDSLHIHLTCQQPWFNIWTWHIWCQILALNIRDCVSLSLWLRDPVNVSPSQSEPQKSLRTTSSDWLLYKYLYLSRRETAQFRTLRIVNILLVSKSYTYYTYWWPDETREHCKQSVAHRLHTGWLHSFAMSQNTALHTSGW